MQSLTLFNAVCNLFAFTRTAVHFGTVDISIKKLCKAAVICYKQWQSGPFKTFSSFWFWFFSSALKAWQKHVLCWQSCCVWQESVKVCVVFAAFVFCYHFSVTKLSRVRHTRFRDQNNKCISGVSLALSGLDYYNTVLINLNYSIQVGSSVIQLSTVIHDLHLFVSKLSMKHHLAKVNFIGYLCIDNFWVSCFFR